jgi:hypothetical protein
MVIVPSVSLIIIGGLITERDVGDKDIHKNEIRKITR